MGIQYQTWLDYVRTHVPGTFPGMHDLLHRFRAAGGHICVVSHSVPENILRDYRAHDLPTPELIYGWDPDPERRKPAPWPIYQIERELGLRPEQLVVIDDLKPGKDMADRAGVDFIAAGCNGMKPQDYFNSIKVQLELMSDLVKEMRIANFNSIKVQLEHPTWSLSEREASELDFLFSFSLRNMMRFP